MKKIIISLLIFVLNLCLFCPSFAEEVSISGGTGKIDLAVAASLHPDMSLFDFQRMAFYRVPLGLSYEEYTKAISELKKKGCDSSLREDLKKLEARMVELAAGVRRLVNQEKTNNPQKMSQEAGDEYREIQRELAESDWKKQELVFSINNPEYTSPDETRARLAKIEKELLEAVKSVAADEGLSLVLNVSVPAPFGYPVKYQLGARYSTGPVGIDQILFYGFLSEKRAGYENYADTEDYLRKWISVTGRPEAVEMLPLQPHPLVLEGGESILTKVLEKIYTDHGIDKEIFDHLRQILLKLNLK